MSFSPASSSSHSSVLRWLCALLVAVAMLPQVSQAQEVPEQLADDQCVVCHFDIESLPEDFNLEDIHLQRGLSCAGCHGGDPTSDDEDYAMSREAGFVGVPDLEEIPEFCGKCHGDINFMRQYQPRIRTDQLSQYLQSHHGQRLKEGAQNVAECASCHTAHAILPASDSRSSVYPLNVPAMCNSCHGDPQTMAGTGLRRNYYSDYAESVHGQALLVEHDLGAPACNDCHGNHGATPPGVHSVSHVCGTCHVNNMEYFVESKMAKAFDDWELHLCEECHGNHSIRHTSDDFLGTGATSVCVNCHEEGEPGYEVAAQMRSHLADLVAAYEATELRAEEVRRVGMDDTDIAFLLQESRQNLIHARTLVHTFDAERVGEVAKEGTEKAREALILAIAEIDGYWSRRMGFGVGTFFITLLAVALFFKIKDMEKESDPGAVAEQSLQDKLDDSAVRGTGPQKP